jgi:hypothetical protein
MERYRRRDAADALKSIPQPMYVLIHEEESKKGRRYCMAQRIVGFIGSMIVLSLVLVACGQANAPVAPTNTPVSETSSDAQIRAPQGDIEAFWDSFDWAELTMAEQEAWGVLGWDETSWDEETSIPASEDATWDELTTEEQAAAEALGYTQETWDATAPQE